MNRMVEWRAAWRHKDTWTKFCVAWHFMSVAALRAELNS